jgi:hypothetical protein
LICPAGYNKFIKDKKRCIDECKNDNIYQYEYLNECYRNCPNGTQEINNNYICENITQTELITEAESQTELATETLSQTELVTETLSQTELATETLSQTELTTETLSQSELAIEALSQTESAIVIESQSETESQTESVKEAESQTESIIEECNLMEGELDLLRENDLSINDITIISLVFQNFYIYFYHSSVNQNLE